jgi:hypothetical protein
MPGGMYDLLDARLPAPSAVTPADQTTTNAYADVTGSTLDTLNYCSVSYTIVNVHATLTIKWKVLGANISDFSDAVEIQAEATIAANGGVGSYSVAQAPFRYYKIQVIDGSGHGTARVRGLAKR